MAFCIPRTIRLIFMKYFKYFICKSLHSCNIDNTQFDRFVKNSLWKTFRNHCQAVSVFIHIGL